MISMGSLSAETGNYENALIILEEARKLSEQIDYRSGFAYSLFELGKVFDFQGKYYQSYCNYLDAQSIFQDLNDDRRDTSY